MQETVQPPKSVHRGRRHIERLTDLQIRRLVKPGTYADGGGLYVGVGATGNKHFLFKYELAGDRHEMRCLAQKLAPRCCPNMKSFERHKLVACNRSEACRLSGIEKFCFDLWRDAGTVQIAAAKSTSFPVTRLKPRRSRELVDP